MLKSLNVNLSKNQFTESEFDVNVKLGNRGLVAKIMTDQVPPRCDALGKDNKLILATGIFAGYGFPTGNRLSFGAKSPLTGGIKEANVGGTLCTYLIGHGIKQIVIEDIATKWSILVIKEDGSYSLEDATSYVGKNTYETTELLYQQYGKKISAALIGPVGEQLHTAASIQVIDAATGHPGRAAARGGLGAVMGSKKIKAIVVMQASDKFKMPVKDPEKLKTARAALYKVSETGGAALKTGGTNVVVDGAINLNFIPVRNFSGDAFTEEETKIFGTAAYVERANQFNGKQGVACQPGCPIQCSNIINDSNGNMITTGLEYETYALGGSNLSIFDIEFTAKFDRLCDEIGIDTIEAGNAIAIAMDAGEIPWGNQEKALELLSSAGTSLIGKAIADGAAATGCFLNHSRVPVSKNQAFPAYDPRSVKGLGVTYATATMGADHTAGHTLSAGINPMQKEMQVGTSQKMQVVGAITDNVCCLFGAGAIFAPEGVAFAQAVFGEDINPAFLQSAGVSTIMMERNYNTQAGVLKSQDVLPEFFRTEKTKKTQTLFDVPQEEMDYMWVPEEYRTLHGFNMETKIFEGKGKLKTVKDLLEKTKAKNILLVYDKGVEKIGIVDTLKTFIDSEKYTVSVFDDVRPDPPFETIKSAVAQVKESSIDMCIAIGGGSSIDSAKAIIAALSYPERPIEMFISGAAYNEKKTVKFIAIPTTSGTGSEVTNGAVITDSKGNKIAVQTCVPDFAIFDPALTLGLPKAITVATGMDVFTHCVGGYTTVKANPVSDAFAEKGMRLVLKNIPILMEDGKNIKAREEMGMAATMGGLVINAGASHIDHSFAHILGAHYHIPHGVCCAMALPFVIEFIADFKKDKIENLCEIFKINAEAMTFEQKTQAVKNYLLDLNKKFEIPTLSSYEQTNEKDIEELALKTVTELLSMFSPRKLEFDDAVEIYKKIFSVK